MRIASGYEDLVAAYRAGPARVREALEGAGAGVLTARGDGWTVRDILHHLVDREVVDAARLRSAIATPEVPLPPVPGEAWHRRLQYIWRSPEAALALLDQLRFGGLEIVGRLGSDAWAREAVESGGGRTTVAGIVRDAIAHMDEHVSQIARIREV